MCPLPVVHDNVLFSRMDCSIIPLPTLVPNLVFHHRIVGGDQPQDPFACGQRRSGGHSHKNTIMECRHAKRRLRLSCPDNRPMGYYVRLALSLSSAHALALTTPGAWCVKSAHKTFFPGWKAECSTDGTKRHPNQEMMG